MTGLKRSLDSNEGEGESPQDVAFTKPASPAASSVSNSSASSFRNVSACNRCRLRKNRCDQRLPSCASCDKAGVKCVGYDPITKREIPRSYVYYLETRVAHLEALLQDNSIAFAPAEDFNPSGSSANGSTASRPPSAAGSALQPRNGSAKPAPPGLSKEESEKYDREKLTKLVSNIGMVSVQGASDPRFLGSTSGISFARVVFAAVKSSVSGSSSERGSVRGAKSLTSNVASTVADGGTSMRDSFFGLHTKPAIRQAPFPDRELGSRLVELYFEHANPQIPILHRGDFMEMFERVYTSGERHRTSRESYMLNIVFAIGAGIIMGSSDSGDSPTSASPSKSRSSPPSNKKRRLAGQQHQPEEYHASAIVHLENFLGSTPASPDGFGGGLEELQAVLLLAGFALLRPVAPGLWYIVGVAVRLGVDLGLHYEDGVGIDGSGSEDQSAGKAEQTEGDGSTAANSAKVDAKERGRRQWVRDLRRRLWWCVYSFDRLVSTWYEIPVDWNLGWYTQKSSIASSDPGAGQSDRIASVLSIVCIKRWFVMTQSSYYHLRKIQWQDRRIGWLLPLPCWIHFKAGRAAISPRLWDVGRPFGITDQVVTTEFPSTLDDRFITKEGFLEPPEYSERSTYKVVAHHYFRLRLLQSEILQVLQYRQAQQARLSGANQGNDFMHTKLPSPFLVNFDSFRAWRIDIDRRLLEWKDQAPTQLDAGVQFSPLFLELNYWQAIIMLFRQSLVVPTGLVEELGNTDANVRSPSVVTMEEREDEELVFLKVAEAGQKVLKLYRQLHRVHLVNYTFLATHHLFMAGISFLYAVWHSPAVRSLLSLDDVDFTVLAATSVLGDLIEKCPPAEACRDAFDRMSKATIQMCMSTTGFGPDALRGMPSNYQTTPTPKSYSPNATYTSTSGGEADARSDTEMSGFPANNNYFSQPTRRQQPRFDMNLRDLFSEDETDKRSFSRISNQLSSMRPPPPPQQIKQEPQQMQQISPRMGNHPQNFNFDPNLRPPQTIPSSQHQQFPTSGGQMTPPLSNTAPMASPYQISNQLPYTAFSSQITQTYPDLGFSDLDFLDSFPVQGAGNGTGLERSDAAGGLQDLGFGMGFGDGTHDWSDGNGFDLFDGFFFGPGGSGGV